MQKSKSINELLASGSRRLADLAAQVKRRSNTLTHVRAALPARLAEHAISAGLEQGRLTIGVSGAVWASRLRYLTDSLVKQVGASMHVPILSVRIRVLPPEAPSSIDPQT
jgi:hypothetical protein